MSAMKELIEAASAILAEELRLAKDSFEEWNGTERVFNEEVWQRNDPEQFVRVKRLCAAVEVAQAACQGKAYFAFLVRRPRDSQAWPAVYENAELALASKLRVSSVVRVHLLEAVKVEPPPPVMGGEGS